MQKITSTSELKDVIQQLEYQRKIELDMLKDNMHQIVESLKPVNIVRGMVQNISSSPGLVNAVINTATGLISGYFSKKIYSKSSNANPIKKYVVGNLLQIGVSRLITRNFDTVRSVGMGIANIFKRKMKKAEV